MKKKFPYIERYNSKVIKFVLIASLFKIMKKEMSIGQPLL